MRQRTGNPSQEVHNDAQMTCFDWFAPAGTDPHAAVLAIEAALPDLKLRVPKDAVLPYTVNGFVNTSLRSDGSLYVCVHLFSQAFSDNPNVPIVAGPNLNPGKQQQMVNAAGGEHGNSKRKINGGNAQGKANDHANLLDAGFTDNDGPMKNT